MKTIEELCEDMCKARLYWCQLGQCNIPRDYDKRIEFDVRYQIASDDYFAKSSKYYEAVQEKAKEASK